MNWQLYRQVIRNDTVLRLGSGVRRNTAAISKLKGQSSSKPISLAPGEIRFEFIRAGEGARRLAESDVELFDASGFEHVPLHSAEENTDTDGYYVLKSADKRPLDPNTDKLYRIDGVLRKKGSRSGLLRTVELAVDSVPNNFGTTEEAYVGVPANAKLVRWFDESANTLEAATPADTIATEFGDVDRYDVASAPSPNSAALVYDLAYAEQGKTDVRVWDERETGIGNKTDADGVVQWARVFITSHEYQGRPVLSNGHLRVLFDEAPSVEVGVTAERWDSGTSSWDPVSLGSNPEGWSLIDVDFVAIGPASADAQLLFEADDGTQHVTNARLTRGDEDILFENPPTETDQTPVSLKDVLTPIASEELKTGGESLGLREREEVRR